MTIAVTFWGTRGSVPAPGPATVKYGGNTACLALTAGSRRLILDAGTGIRSLGRALDGEEVEATVLLSHSHWDHIQGLPFFRPLHRAGARVTIFGPAQPGPPLETTLRHQMESAVFPIGWEALAAEVTVRELDAGEHDLAGFLIRSLPLCHPGATLGYSVTHRSGGPVVAYLTDNELGGEDGRRRRAEFVRFLQGADLLVHDAMFFDADRVGRRGWGHSSATEAVELAVEAEVRRLVLFHHDPDHSDDRLERLLEEADALRVRLGGRLDVTLAMEGATIPCG